MKRSSHTVKHPTRNPTPTATRSQAPKAPTSDDPPTTPRRRAEQAIRGDGPKRPLQNRTHSPTALPSGPQGATAEGAHPVPVAEEGHKQPGSNSARAPPDRRAAAKLTTHALGRTNHLRIHFGTHCITRAGAPVAACPRIRADRTARNRTKPRLRVVSRCSWPSALASIWTGNRPRGKEPAFWPRFPSTRGTRRGKTLRSRHSERFAVEHAPQTCPLSHWPASDSLDSLSTC